ncbi:MAG: hypothetical protein CL812_10130 [Confluentimicrobium sp.]|mgnify:FL=1|nr:hypothetical protein [Actibacterium sp.]|tara:strand:- start:452 stop:1066 length:615 start_codon:yes stop_codon:yes gene_type:complete
MATSLADDLRPDDGSHAARDILDKLDDCADKGRSLTLDDLLSAFGRRSYGPVLVVTGLLGASPLGAIPTLPSLLALIGALYSAQIVLGRDRLWIPDMLKSRKVPADKLGHAVKKLHPVADFLDRYTGRRLEVLVRAPSQRLAGAICLLLAALVPPLELVPFAAMLPHGVIALFGLALTARDGVIMALALAASVATGYAAYSFLM